MENVKKPKPQNVYDDRNIPDVDLPQDSQHYSKDSVTNLPIDDYESVEPLPESTRPRKDGPGGGE